MSKLILIFLLLTSLAQATIGTYKNGKFIYPDTNKPYTGNLDVINNDWGKDAVEFNKDYVDGVLHGAEKVFYRSGKLKSIGYFNKGLIDGTTTLYYEDGAVQAQVSFNNGIREGRAVSYYPDGTKQSEQFYVTDKLYGLSRQWFDTGSLMITRDYSRGLLHGEIRTYYESGKVFEVTRFNYGTPKSKFIYHEDGSLADKQGFLNRKIIDSIIS
jgi:antitoxin component YwqK of YwqJK toxin-antitoxin module